MSQQRTSRWAKAAPAEPAADPIPPWRLPRSNPQWGSSSDSWDDRTWQDNATSANDWSDQYSWDQPYATTSRKVTWNEEASWESGYDASTTNSGFHGTSIYSTFQEDVSTEEWPAEVSFHLVPPSPPLKRRIPITPTIEFCTFILDGKQPIEKTEQDASSQACSIKKY